METVSSSALKKKPLIKVFLTSWVKQNIIPTALRIKEKQTHIEGRLAEQWLRQKEIEGFATVVTSSKKSLNRTFVYLFMRSPPMIEMGGKKKNKQFIFLDQCAGHAFHKIWFFLKLKTIRRCCWRNKSVRNVPEQRSSHQWGSKKGQNSKICWLCWLAHSLQHCSWHLAPFQTLTVQKQLQRSKEKPKYGFIKQQTKQLARKLPLHSRIWLPASQPQLPTGLSTSTSELQFFELF